MRASGFRYSVAYGNHVHCLPSPLAAVRIQSTDAGLEVDTGAIRFLVSKSRFGILEAVRQSSGEMLQSGPIAAEIVEAGGRTWRAAELPVEKIEVEQSGPLHAVIRAETRLAPSGKPAAGFYHRVRIHAYAGSSLVQLDYFVANTDSRAAGDVGGSMASKVSGEIDRVEAAAGESDYRRGLRGGARGRWECRRRGGAKGRRNGPHQGG